MSHPPKTATARSLAPERDRRAVVAALAALAVGGGGSAAGGARGARRCRRAAVRTLCGGDCPAFPPECRLFPPDHVWNTPATGLAVHPRSDRSIDAIGRGAPLHADFGSGLWEGGPIGIPMAVARGVASATRVRFVEYGEESDPGPYYLPPDARIEGGPCGRGDRHVLVVDADRCRLYELYHARPDRHGGWTAGSGAVWDLDGYDQRPAGWTSADASGMAMLPGLVRYDEVAAGRIPHALRFTAAAAQKAHVWPAVHWPAADPQSPLPAMGHRFRLKALVDTAGFSATNRVILAALREFGMMLADFGSNWFLSGVPDERWDNDDLADLRRITGDDFECVDAAPLSIDPGSAQARQNVAGGA